MHTLTGFDGNQTLLERKNRTLSGKYNAWTTFKLVTRPAIHWRVVYQQHIYEYDNELKGTDGDHLLNLRKKRKEIDTSR